MHIAEIIIGLLVVVSILAAVAERMKIAYPIFLTLSGLAIGFIPGIPTVTIDPHLVFLFFLPPILYVSSLNTSWRDFKGSIRAISLLAVGLVIATTVVVAVVAKFLIPGMSWPAAFILGAIISPPDAVAATSVCRRLGVPRKVITIIEGESLVNDATGLIAYRFAVAAAVSGFFSLWEASLEFVYVGVGGVIFGLVIAYIAGHVRKNMNFNPTVGTIMSLLTPYAAYVPAEALGVSGVLAVVSCGIFLTRRSQVILSARTRLQTTAVWETVIYILNCVIFILIGLQLPQILDALSNYKFSDLLLYAAKISLAVILLRIVWVYIFAYAPRFLSKRIREKEARPPLNNVGVVAWIGMRGIVSLAAALAMPFEDAAGNVFAERDIIIFLTFGVIFATLVLQGLTFPWIIKILKVKKDDVEEREELEGRIYAVSAAVKYLEDYIKHNPKLKESLTLQRILDDYKEKLAYFTALKASKTDEDCSLTNKEIHKIRHQAIKAEREALSKLRDKEVISDEILRKIIFDIDIEETSIKER